MAKVYVGTYKKYNEGSIDGKWLDLEDYADKDDFMEACAELHNDEEDPEFMFQDWEDIPDSLIGESWINEDLWEWLDMDDDDKEILDAYLSNFGTTGTFTTDKQNALEAYMGRT